MRSLPCRERSNISEALLLQGERHGDNRCKHLPHSFIYDAFFILRGLVALWMNAGHVSITHKTQFKKKKKSLCKGVKCSRVSFEMKQTTLVNKLEISIFFPPWIYLTLIYGDVTSKRCFKSRSAKVTLFSAKVWRLTLVCGLGSAPWLSRTSATLTLSS